MSRRKIQAHNNNAGEDADTGPTPAKRGRVIYNIELPKRRTIIGNVLVCGTGDMGQLGLGEDVMERKRPAIVDSIANPVDVCAGGMHCLVLTKNGDIYSFGCNDEGALGRDTSEEGAEFIPAPIELPGKALVITAGDSHSACLLEDGRVFAWGSFRDSHGNMGLTIDGNKRSPINLLPGTTCASIASGSDHLVILTTSGKVFTVGCAEQGQLGRISERSVGGEGRRGKQDLLRPDQLILKRAKPIEAIWATNYCTFMRESQTQTIWAVGLNNYKQLVHEKAEIRVLVPIKTNLKEVKQLAGGQHHTLVLDNNQVCYSIGRPDYGRLGLGQVKDIVEVLTPIKALSNEKISFVGCGEACSYAITQDGKLYSWGMGSNSQLGVGDGDDELVPVLVVSKNTQDKRVLLVDGGGQHSIFLIDSNVQEQKENLPVVNVQSGATSKSSTSTTTTTEIVAVVSETSTNNNNNNKKTTVVAKKTSAVSNKRGQKKSKE